MSFPIPLAEVAGWDLEAIGRSARVAPTEAAAAGLHCISQSILGNVVLPPFHAAVGPSRQVVYAEGAKLVVGERTFSQPSRFNTTDRSGLPADAPNTPLFPVGCGLSHTTFTYSEPQLDRTDMERDDTLRVSVTVTSSVTRPGGEVVQFYVRDPVGSRTRPVKRLVGFRKVEIPPGASIEVTLDLRSAELASHAAAGRWEAEPGDFVLHVGPNSREVREAGFRLR